VSRQRGYQAVWMEKKGRLLRKDSYSGHVLETDRSKWGQKERVREIMGPKAHRVNSFCKLQVLSSVWLKHIL
jgi:hypothetical protein